MHTASARTEDGRVDASPRQRTRDTPELARARGGASVCSGARERARPWHRRTSSREGVRAGVGAIERFLEAIGLALES